MSSKKTSPQLYIDLLTNILDRAENPEGLSDYLVCQMRELLGGELVALLEFHPESPDCTWTIPAWSPDRPLPPDTIKALGHLATSFTDMPVTRFFSANEDSNLGRLLRRGPWRNLAVLPLGFATFHHSLLFLLNINDASPVAEILLGMDPLGRMIGLALKNQTLYKDMENTIEQRTSQLAASELRFRTLTETAAVGVFQCDLDGNCDYVNEKWCEMSGLSPFEALSASWTAGLHPVDRPKVLTEWHTSIEQQHLFAMDFRFQRPDNSIVWVFGQVAPLYQMDGSTIGFVGTITDISARIHNEQILRGIKEELEKRVGERTQELQTANLELQRVLDQTQLLQEAIIVKEKLASLTPLVAGVSHELNTPIGNIAVLSSALQERLVEFRHNQSQNPSPKNLDCFMEYLEKTNEMVMRSAGFASTLVQSFKKVVVAREGVQKRKFQLSELVDDCLNLIRPSYKKSPWILENAVDPVIEMDSYPGTLGQVLDNLVRNALIHAFEGRAEGKVRIHTENTDGIYDHILLIVSDNGKGIPFRHRNKVFDPFFTTHLGSGGSGLGLSIVYNLVQQVLGGTIKVESQSVIDGSAAETSGSHFILDIPIKHET